MEKKRHRQVSNLYSPRETDFESVGNQRTTRPRPLEMSFWATVDHEWIFKVCIWHSPREIDIDSPLGQDKLRSPRTPSMSESRCVFPKAIKTMLSADFEPVQFKRNRFRLCHGAHLTKTTWDEDATKPSMSKCQGVFRYIKKPGDRQVSNLWSPRETDFDSVVATSRLDPWLRSTSDETIL